VALGVTRNTAHRAVRRLVEAGLAAPLQERSNDGCFVTGCYRLVITVDVLQIDGPAARPSTLSQHRSERCAHRPCADCQQLSLLPSHD
jgi:hypothetical protein